MVICIITEEWGKLTGQPRDVIPNRQNEQRKVEII
jgi:hypothetical protein